MTVSTASKLLEHATISEQDKGVVTLSTNERRPYCCRDHGVETHAWLCYNDDSRVPKGGTWVTFVSCGFVSTVVMDGTARKRAASWSANNGSMSCPVVHIHVLR